MRFRVSRENRTQESSDGRERSKGLRYTSTHPHPPQKKRCCPVNHCTSFILNHCKSLSSCWSLPAKHRLDGILCFFPHCWPTLMFLLKTLVSVPIQSEYIWKWASVIGILYNNCNNYLYLPSGNQIQSSSADCPREHGKGEAFILHENT